MLAYVILLAAATPDTPDQTRYVETSAKICADVSANNSPSACPSPSTFEAPLSEVLKTNPRGAIPFTNPGSWVSTNDYPSLALREERGGISGFTLAVSADGKVSSCSITAPSGSTDLDEATCANISRRARFYPATDIKGRPIAAAYTNRVTWRIPERSTYNYAFDNDFSAAYPRSPIADHYFQWPEPADYPTAVKNAGHEGETLVALTIDEQGKVATCEVAKTSGFTILDEASCPFASTKWTFKPALDFDGKPTKGRIEKHVGWYSAGAMDVESWKAQPRKPNANVFKDPGKVVLQFELDAKGQPLNCKVTSEGLEAMVKQGGANMLDFCELFSQPGMVTFEPFVDAVGKPESRIISVEIEMKHLREPMPEPN